MCVVVENYVDGFQQQGVGGDRVEGLCRACDLGNGQLKEFFERCGVVADFKSRTDDV
jgi:hypothetical protein